MFILVTGGASCGKSEYGEKLLKTKKDKLYIATMKPYGDEEFKKIAKHRLMRQGKGFETLEAYENISALRLKKRYDAILFECISNVLANEKFGSAGGNENKNIVEGIFNAVQYLSKNTESLVVISNQVDMDGLEYDTVTSDYIKQHTEINARLAEIADTVIEVVFGIPIFLKGELKNEIIN